MHNIRCDRKKCEHNTGIGVCGTSAAIHVGAGGDVRCESYKNDFKKRMKPYWPGLLVAMGNIEESFKSDDGDKFEFALKKLLEYVIELRTILSGHKGFDKREKEWSEAIWAVLEEVLNLKTKKGLSYNLPVGKVSKEFESLMALAREKGGYWDE